MTTLPSNVEAEAALLGAMMCSNKVIDRVLERVAADDFFEPLHGRIFSAIAGQHSLGKIATPVTLRPFFENDDSMKQVGGGAYLAQLTGSGATVIGAGDFADHVRELAQRRALMDGLQAAIVAAGECETPLDDIVAEADSAINAVRDAGEDAGEYSVGEALDLVINGMNQFPHSLPRPARSALPNC